MIGLNNINASICLLPPRPQLEFGLKKTSNVILLFPVVPVIFLLQGFLLSSLLLSLEPQFQNISLKRENGKFLVSVFYMYHVWFTMVPWTLLFSFWKFIYFKCGCSTNVTCEFLLKKQLRKLSELNIFQARKN